MTATDDAIREAIIYDRPMTFLDTLSADGARFNHAVRTFTLLVAEQIRNDFRRAIGPGSGE